MKNAQDGWKMSENGQIRYRITAHRYFSEFYYNWSIDLKNHFSISTKKLYGLISLFV